MKTKSKIGTLLLVGLMASTALASVVRAETAATPTVAAPTYATQTQMLRLSEEGRTALMSAQAARMALFNDKHDAARSDIERGIGALEAASATMKDVMIPGTDAADAKAEYLPFDTKFGLSETFVATPEKQAALGKAQGLFQSDTPDAAVEVLRNAGVEVVVSTALLPGESAIQHLKDARSLLDEGKFYEANLALKAVEDSVIVRTFGIEAIPAQGVTAAHG